MKFSEVLETIKERVVMGDREFNIDRLEEYVKKCIFIATEDNPKIVFALNNNTVCPGRILAENLLFDTNDISITIKDETGNFGIGITACLTSENLLPVRKKIEVFTNIDFYILKEHIWTQLSPSNIDSPYIGVHWLTDKKNVLQMYKIVVEDNPWAFNKKTNKLVKKIK